MNIDTNPFYLRASEHIEEDEVFLKLFSPEILNVFNTESPWATVNIIRSSPGGGKTTLLKIFTPSFLSKIHNLKQDEPYRKLFKTLIELKAFKNNSINVAGSLLSITSEYSLLEELEVNRVHKNRLFYALLNARIAISILKSICEVKEINFPDDLFKINFNIGSNINLPPGVPIKGSGLIFYDWASSLEELICKEIDSVFPITANQLHGHDSLFTLRLMSPNNITLEGEKISEKILVMFDDVHNLSRSQRQFLIKSIIDLRPPVNVWLSERFQALTIEEIISPGNKISRDLNIIDLEEYWRKGKKFEDFAKSVADRRINMATDGNLTSFSGCLPTEFNKKDQPLIKKALIEVETQVKEKFSNVSYQQWIDSKELNQGTDYEKLIGWKSLQILLNRSKNQQTSIFNELNEEDLISQEGSDVKNAAKLFLNYSYNIPYYYGFTSICKLASFNIEQFLEISGELFEEIISDSIFKLLEKRRKIEVSPSKQESIIRNLSNVSWSSLSLRIPNFSRIEVLLNSIGNLSNEETYLPNAWNSPGINGVAIPMDERDYLRDVLLNKKNNGYTELAECLAICIAYNLLEYRLNYKCQGREWMVLYLNKLYCVKFNLPLNYSGFKRVRLKDLREWLYLEYKPNEKLW